MLSRSESIIFVRTLKRSFRLLKTKLFNAGLNHTSFLIQDDHKSKTSSSLNASSHLIPISWMSTYTYIRVTYPDQREVPNLSFFSAHPPPPTSVKGGRSLSTSMPHDTHTSVWVDMVVISLQSLKRVPRKRWANSTKLVCPNFISSRVMLFVGTWRA